MSALVLCYLLTVFAAGVVLLARLRLRRPGVRRGRHAVSPGLLNTHTWSGAGATVLWLVFLAMPEDHLLGGSLMGIIAIGLWWVLTLAGLLLLLRWLPSKGRHLPPGRSSWLTGPGLALLCHLGVAVAVGYFTYAYGSSLV